MSKYNWADMEVCKTCHFADKDPDICNAFSEPREKPSKMDDWTDVCARWTRSSKWDRMTETERRQLLERFGVK